MCLKYVRISIRHIQSTIRKMVFCLAKQDAFVNTYSKACHIDDSDFKQDGSRQLPNTYIIQII